MSHLINTWFRDGIYFVVRKVVDFCVWLDPLVDEMPAESIEYSEEFMERLYKPARKINEN